MRSDFTIQTEFGDIAIPKWLPEKTAPPPAVVVFFSGDDAEALESSATLLTDSGYVVAQIRTDAKNTDLARLKAQYDAIKNRYLAVPFYAVSDGKEASSLANYSNRYEEDFFGMIWQKPDVYATDDDEDDSLFERIGDWIGIEIGDEQLEISALPPVPLAIFTDDLREITEMLSGLEQKDELILHIIPPHADHRMKTWLARSFVRQLDAWHRERIEILEKTKRGALKWDREKE